MIIIKIVIIIIIIMITVIFKYVTEYKCFEINSCK